MGGIVSRNYKNKKKQTRMFLLRKSDICGICGGKFSSLKDVTLDHIVPVSHGGGNNIENLQLAHKDCNSRKGDSV